MLAMQLKIGIRDEIGVGHIVVYCRSRSLVRAGTIFLSPANRGVNRHNGYVDALRHKFSCHAFCESGLGMTRHCEGATRRKAFERRARVCEDDRSLRAVGVSVVFAHDPSRLLTYQERTER